MDAPSRLSRPVTDLITQARITTNSPHLNPNIQKLSKDQVKTLVDILNNQDHFINNYIDGSKPDWEKNVIKITNVLAGTSRGSILSLGKTDRAQLLQTVTDSQKSFNKPLILTKGTTSSLVNSLQGTELRTDAAIDKQFHRDMHNLKDHIFVNNMNILIMDKPKINPGWEKLFPDDLKIWLNDNPTTIRNVALMMQQGIATDAWDVGLHQIKDPLYPEAKFKIDGYPSFHFTKSIHGEISLEVRMNAHLGLPDYEKGGDIPIKNYSVTQLINLYNPNADVVLVIKPEKHQH